MLNKEKIIEIALKLGVIEEEKELNNIVEVINFVNELFIFNDEDSIKNFLVCIVSSCLK